MKKLLPFLFLSLFLLVGCKEDDEDDKPKSTTELLQGKWNIQSEKVEYYNASNAKIFEENDPTSGTITITGQNFDVSLSGITFNGTYTTSETNGKKYLTINLLGDTETAEILTLTESNLTWQSETLNDTYEEGGTIKPAAKSISTVQLQKAP